MFDSFDTLFEFVRGFGAGREALLGNLALLAVGSLVLTLGVLPWVVVRLPEDYFQHRTAREAWADVRTPLALAGRILRNVVGLAFVLAGIAMLVLPGQGLLTLLVGLVLVDFPGKFRLERFLVRRGGVLRALNALRARFGTAPLRRPRPS